MVERSRGKEVDQGRWYAIEFPGDDERGLREFSHYVHAGGLMGAVIKAAGLVGWERDVHINGEPTIRPLSPVESSLLEKIIKKLPNVNMNQAIKHGFQGVRNKGAINIEEILKDALRQRRIDSRRADPRSQVYV